MLSMTVRSDASPSALQHFFQLYGRGHLFLLIPIVNNVKDAFVHGLSSRTKRESTHGDDLIGLQPPCIARSSFTVIHERKDTWQ